MVMNFVTPNIKVKCALLLNRPDLEAGLLNIYVRLKQHTKV
jgi:hypothetical protein